MVHVIDKEKFKSEVFDYSTLTEWQFDKKNPVILNFFAEWCGPCHRFAPILNELAETHGEKIKILKIDIDKDPEIAALFGVQSVPTTLFLKPNEEPIMTSGALPAESMNKAVKEIFGL